MRNVEMKQEGNRLVIIVDLSKNHGPSKSGKTIIVASTDGNVAAAPGVMIGLNVYRKG